VRFRALDGWRGVCALLVALHHIEVRGWLYSLSLVRHAWMFVDFFFVLSGFVIAFAYSEKLSCAIDIRGFMVRRFGRIYPLHAAILVCLVLLELVHLAFQHLHPVPDDPGAFGPGRSIFGLLTNLLLVQDFGLHNELTWNGPAWSISAEFYTYLVFAIVCVLVPSRNVRVSVAALLILSSVVLLLHVSPHGMRETFQWGFVRCLFGFFTGTLSYEIWRTGRTQWLAGSAFEFFAATASIAFVCLVPGHAQMEYFATPVFALAVLVFAQEGGAISKAMISRPVAALGRWSYSIYIVHTLVIACAFSAFHMIELAFHPGWITRTKDGHSIIALPVPLLDDLLCLVILGVVIGLASLTYRHIERPGQRWAARFAQRHPVEILPQMP